MRHGLAGVQQQVEKGLAKHRHVAVDVRDAGAIDTQLVAGDIRLGSNNWNDFVVQIGQAHRLQLQIFGPGELQEALNDLVEPPDFIGYDVDMFECGGAIYRSHGGQLTGSAPGRDEARRSATSDEYLTEQLKVNHHRVQRVLHLVGDTG